MPVVGQQNLGGAGGAGEGGWRDWGMGELEGEG